MREANIRALRRYPKVGWRALIGVIHPGVGVPGPADFHKIAPKGVNMALAFVPPHKDESVEEMTKLADHVVEMASSRIFELWKPDVMLWCCTAGSFLRGAGFDQQLIRGMEKAAGVPATTTSTAMIHAFKELGLKKICVATPYPADANKIEKKFIEDNGVEVLRCEGFEFVDHRDIVESHPQDYYDLVKKINLPEADGLFISCTGLDVFDIIEPLEKELGKPVLTANQVSFWEAFKMARVGDPIKGYGTLLDRQR